ncbi:uncharacterized protein LOC129273265 [Lytechinus pictus]|uniref:uncharacterized protein LOC129273265 n=1 Tax=Lytechinus pictus TaxID=7653 RepID=UPI0030B9CE83
MLASIVSATEHIAKFSMRGVSGRVVFTEDANTMGVRIEVDPLVGLMNGQDYHWNIRALPMLYDREDKCAEEHIGPVLKNLTTSVGSLTNVTTGSSYVDPMLRLGGSSSISGRTLAIEDANSVVYCASIIPSDDVITAVAQFGTPIAGTVTFRQRAVTDAVTTIFVDLYDVTEPIAAQDYNWHISDNTGITNEMTVEEWCTATSTETFADVGDLTARFGSVNVKTVHLRQRYFFIDTNITLNGADSILNKSLVFTLPGDGDNKAACSPIRVVRSKTVRAEFSQNNVTGVITFTQASLWESTTITVDLNNLRQMAGGYHVHKFPVPMRFLTSDFPGSADNVAGHFNPYNIDTTTDPDYPNGTNDQYEIGDISGKFGSLAGQNDFSGTFEDWNMPLFGKNSIVGRSVIIHLANSARWAYGIIEYPTPVRTVTSVFTYPLVGQITFRQDAEDPYSDTSVFVDLAHSDGEDTTVEHDWHIHVAKLGDDHLDQTGRCSSTLGHFNPFDVKLTEEYATECGIDVTRRCEVGDFSKKYGRITVPGSMRTQVGKYFFTDVQLPLSGVYSVADRSVVVHVKDGAPERLGCGDTLEVFQATATASSWIGVADSGTGTVRTPVMGFVTLTQNSEFDSVTIATDLDGLSNVVGPWHIHILPVPYSDINPCSATSTQGHYNPFGVIGSPPVGTFDYYENGDLSGKFGYWDGLSDISTTYLDSTLSLFGPRSVSGRSVIVHRSDDGSRYRCSSLLPVLGDGDFRIEAEVQINTPDVTGSFILGQTHFSNDRLSETTIQAQFSPVDVLINDVYDWTIRTDSIPASSCPNANSIFNPNTVATAGDYSSQCSIASQLRCQVGDLTGKNGNYSSYHGRALLTDTNLPLTGTSGVIGLPLYLESSDGNIVCGTIQPLPSTGLETSLTFPQMIDFDVYSFKLAMANILTDVESWQIVAPHYPVNSEDRERCMDLQLWIIGKNAVAANTELQRKAADDELGIYSTTDRCRGDGTGAAGQILPIPALIMVFVAVVTSLWQHVLTS